MGIKKYFPSCSSVVIQIACWKVEICVLKKTGYTIYKTYGQKISFLHKSRRIIHICWAQMFKLPKESAQRTGYIPIPPTCISRRTNTLVARSIVHTRSSILAYIGLACVKFILASYAGVISRTRTVQTRAEILTGASVHAGVANTTLRGGLTLLPVRAWRTPVKLRTEWSVPLVPI